MLEVLVASVGALAAITVYALSARRSAMDRKRVSCAEAMADALAWMELPYRIARRLDDSPETCRALADRMHHLQERLLYHSSWLQIEVPRAALAYELLLSKVRDEARPHLQEAWRRVPLGSAAEMNLGPFDTAPIEGAVVVFTKAIRDRFRWWRF